MYRSTSVQGSTDSQVRHDGEDVNEPPSDSINFLWTVADVDRNTREFLHIKERAETFGMNENFKGAITFSYYMESNSKIHYFGWLPKFF